MIARDSINGVFGEHLHCQQTRILRKHANTRAAHKRAARALITFNAEVVCIRARCRDDSDKGSDARVCRQIRGGKTRRHPRRLGNKIIVNNCHARLAVVKVITVNGAREVRADNAVYPRFAHEITAAFVRARYRQQHRARHRRMREVINFARAVGRQAVGHGQHRNRRHRAAARHNRRYLRAVCDD